MVCLRWKARHIFHKRGGLFFLHNDACRFALIKGRSASDPMFRMAHACACLYALILSFTWVERVCSYSNSSDLPSRGQHEETCHRWNLQFAGDIAPPAELVATLVDGAPFPKAELQNGDLGMR